MRHQHTLWGIATMLMFATTAVAQDGVDAPDSEDALEAPADQLDDAATLDDDDAGILVMEAVVHEGEIDMPDTVYVLSPSEVDPGDMPAYSPLDDPNGGP